MGFGTRKWLLPWWQLLGSGQSSGNRICGRIRCLYDIEKEAKELDALARAGLRQCKAVPLLADMKLWLERQRVEVLPKSPMAEAITYTLNQWEALQVYTRDGNLAIDNNVAERAVKPFAIGRKNWLFFGSDQGGNSLAILANPPTIPAESFHTLFAYQIVKVSPPLAHGHCIWPNGYTFAAQ